MNYSDSPHEIITDVHLRNNGVLHRFNNPAGAPYSAIYIGNREEASCERYRESGMIRWWNTSESSESRTPEEITYDLISLEHGSTDNFTPATIDYLMRWLNIKDRPLFSLFTVWELVFNSPRLHPDQMLYRIPSRFPRTGFPSTFTTSRERIQNLLNDRPEADYVLACNLKRRCVRYYPFCDAVQTLRNLPNTDRFKSKSYEINEILNNAKVEQEYVVLETDDMIRIPASEFKNGKDS